MSATDKTYINAPTLWILHHTTPSLRNKDSWKRSYGDLRVQDPDSRVDRRHFPEVKTVDGYQGREKEALPGIAPDSFISVQDRKLPPLKS